MPSYQGFPNSHSGGNLLPNSKHTDMDSNLRHTASRLIYITENGVPEAVNNWACFGFAKSENHPYELYLDHADIGGVSDGVTHIACIGILHVRKPLLKPVHIIAHTLVFDEAPEAHVQFSCHTLVLYGNRSYSRLKYIPLYPCVLDQVYSFGSDYPLLNNPNAHVFQGDPVITDPSMRGPSIIENQIRTCNDYAHGLNDLHLAAIQALTVRQTYYLVQHITSLNPDEIRQSLKIHTAPDVNMEYFRDERKLPSLTPFQHLPIKDLNRIFSNRSIYDLSKLISTPFLAGYRRAGAFDPSILPETLVEFMKETDRFLPQNNPMLWNTSRTDTPSCPQNDKTLPKE